MKVFLVAGEQSGDQLGFKLMRALRAQLPQNVDFSGVGGDAMIAEGLDSLFPMENIAVMGLLPVIRRLPTLLQRIRQTADAVLVAAPDVLVLIDSPDFTHRVARLVRKRRPDLPIVDYVSPTVWAWRPGRAKTMRPIIDHVLALLPFEPAVHTRLGGPVCTYVGHPLIERLAELRQPADVGPVARGQLPVVLILPGSRRSEIARLMPVFGDALAQFTQQGATFETLLPAVPHLEAEIRRHVEHWAVKPRIVLGEADKHAAMRLARVALAASGTVTLELALAGVPMVVAYKVGILESCLRFLVTAPSIVLPNLILEENIVPEFIQQDCTATKLADAMGQLFKDGQLRQKQISALARLDALMMLGLGETPSQRAAQIIIATARHHAKRG